MVSEIDEYMSRLIELCDTFGVKRLELFGSATRSDFDLEQSDIDFLVDFDTSHSLGPFDQYFGLKEALERLLGRSIDLIEEKAIKNPYFKEAIAQDRMLVYGTRG